MAESQERRSRLQRLQSHLEQEHPILVDLLPRFESLDRVAMDLGVLQPHQSYADLISWWPVIAILGTFSAGKSTFINHFIGKSLQRTGIQAVDDKFTVISFSEDPQARVLPGIALDADPRFPLYRISQRLEEPGAAQRIDSYLQLKTCASESLRGIILIDSPGFDADAQRDAVLRITHHIIDQSDLVLVFFDARHPEPGAMPDTLEHLVATTVQRADAQKFLYILNQIDAAANEDNPEEIVAAWQRAVAQAGLRSGPFYRIYNPEVAVPIRDPGTRERFERKRDADLAEIHQRIAQLPTDRAYRIIQLLEEKIRELETGYLPWLRVFLQRWRSRLLRYEGLALASCLVLVVVLALVTPVASLVAEAQAIVPGWWFLGGLAGIILAMALVVHGRLSRFAGEQIIAEITRDLREPWLRDALSVAMRRHLRPSFALLVFLRREPLGWSGRTKRRLASIAADARSYVQVLNDHFTQGAVGHSK